MNSRIILVAVLMLGLLVLVSMWPVLVRRFFRGVENRNDGKRARKELESGSPGEIMEEVDARIAEQQGLVDKYTQAGSATFAAGADEPLHEAHRELRELKKYRERLIHEARERGFRSSD